MTRYQAHPQPHAHRLPAHRQPIQRWQDTLKAVATAVVGIGCVLVLGFAVLVVGAPV